MPRTPAIEEDQPTEGGQPLQERSQHRVFPAHVDVSKTRDVDHIPRSVAHDLVGDLGPAHLRVTGLRPFHSRQQFAVRPYAAAIWTRASVTMSGSVIMRSWPVSILHSLPSLLARSMRAGSRVDRVDSHTMWYWGMVQRAVSF